MDPRGRETDALGAAGSLARLTEATGAEFPALLAARQRTEERLLERRQALATLPIDPDAAIVLMGSWGRLEVTAGSDDDFMCLVDGALRGSNDVRPGIEETWKALGGTGRRPGREEIFGVPAFSQELRTIGLEDDGNLNLTRRLLLLLESRAVAGEGVSAKVKAEVLEAYLHELAKDYRPPRFLLNDVIRYWRTIAVDSRRSTDRVSSCFLNQGRPDSGARAMAAYDAFISMLDDENARYELETLPYEDRDLSGRWGPSPPRRARRRSSCLEPKCAKSPLLLICSLGWRNPGFGTNSRRRARVSSQVKNIDEMEAIYRGAFKRARAELGVESFGMQVIDLPPNYENYPEHDHAHDNQEEVFLVLRGGGEIEIDGERFPLDGERIARVGPETKRKLWPGSEGVRVVVLGGVPGEAYQAPDITKLGEPDPTVKS